MEEKADGESTQFRNVVAAGGGSVGAWGGGDPANGFYRGTRPSLAHLIRKIRRDRGLLVPIVSPLGLALTPDLTRELLGPPSP